MRKIWAITWKELFTAFTDRNRILIMIATPLALSTIVGFAFGGGGGDVPIRDIPILIVNHDEGNALGISYGGLFASVLAGGSQEGSSPGALPACEASGEAGAAAEDEVRLEDITDAVVFDAPLAESLIDDGRIQRPDAPPGTTAYLEAAAKAAVDSGFYTAMVVIPADYSARISYVPGAHPTLEATGIRVYGNRGGPISSGIVRSIAEGLQNQILMGNIAIAATFQELEAAHGPATVGEAAAGLDFAAAFGCAFTPTANTVRLDVQSVGGSDGGGLSTAVLVAVGSAQAMFFALFTAQFGVLSMYYERQEWTLQRLLMSPTRRSYILAGKLVGVFTTVLFQLLLLFLSLTLVGSLMRGELIFIWGSDFLRIALVVLAAGLAVSGYGMLLSGIVKTPEQGQIFGSLATMAMAVLGGAFGFAPPGAVSLLSMIYWGREAFQLLAAGSGNVGLHILVLAAQGLVMFVVGLVLFERRFDPMGAA